MTETSERRPRGRPKSSSSDETVGTIRSLDRGLSLLKDLAKDGGITLTELSLRAGLPASTTYRMLSTLQSHGFVELDEASQEWWVGIETFRVGSAYLTRTNVVEAARQIMHQLMEETGETSNLAIADDGDVVFVSQVETHQPIRAFFRPGTRGHMHASGIGKALLADMQKRHVKQILQKKGLPEFTDKTLTSTDSLLDDLSEIKKRGWSLDDEERYSGMRCVAASIYNTFGEAVAGISISGPTVRMSDQAVAELGPKVKRAADEVTHIIGGQKPQTKKTI
ncbi:MAG: HTH-type transcriptional regulator BhcR [Cellvibrionaceae bacterium]